VEEWEIFGACLFVCHNRKAMPIPALLVKKREGAFVHKISRHVRHPAADLKGEGDT